VSDHFDDRFPTASSCGTLDYSKFDNWAYNDFADGGVWLGSDGGEDQMYILSNRNY